MDKPQEIAKKINLCNLGTAIKLLFTGYLSTILIGYLMALAQILMTHGMADGKFGLSLNDIVYSYYGNRSGSTLEQKLNGSMKANASDAERFKIIQWVRDGASTETYAKEIQPIIQTRCVLCHNSNGNGIPDFSDYANLQKLTQANQGITYQSLTRVSHIHLFGISFIFMFVGLIFSLTTGVPKTLKYSAIIMPYLFLILDIASWWLTKLNPNFALLIILGGTGLAIAFAYMWTISIYQMWFMESILKHPDRRNAIFRD